MMQKLLLSLFAMMAVVTMQANDHVATQEVQIDGQTVAKEVRKITFNGDNAVLTFADQSSQEVDMESLLINFTYGTTAVSQVKSPVNGQQKVYNLKGQYVKNGVSGLKKGVYVVDGKKIIIK